ncbi:CDP-2,3-bis-(O-geranylgeranyl)-sn-glycerol synthase [Candidatus Bathyarchaeota archaeon]|nr:CDP-2,3-bis-(O-geranylgeranyl)-sn-glycerol synthase [Candidatus Bathyarchaeota archaeon]NIW16435.1 CDP-2,3-bis-(O-geranylgeranyl)-sn-glycerol synthase [Candidatus Bathyarchaeota archaeon]NIW34298.1 CDP-2,3-bis-(O-geranylgeranyl)-sn-glycerol synthase [Candidatus Bathyarchaeota archaeon]
MFITFLDVVEALIFIFPAYWANGMPVIFGGGRPIDGNRRFWDGRPVFGSHKTLRGFFAGIAIGTLVGAIECILFRTYSSALSRITFSPGLMLGFVLSCGALMGDLTDSFIKRRLDISPGSPLPVIDQLDFVIGALLLGFIVDELPRLPVILIIFAITPPIHLLTNLSAYLLDVKKEWW